MLIESETNVIERQKEATAFIETIKEISFDGSKSKTFGGKADKIDDFEAEKAAQLLLQTYKFFLRQKSNES